MTPIGHSARLCGLSLALAACAGRGHLLQQERVTASVRPMLAEGRMVSCDSLADLVATAAGLSPNARTLVRSSLERHEGMVVRWATPRGPIRVWVEPRMDEPTFGRLGSIDTWTKAVHHAVADWSLAGAGIQLRLVGDSTAADIRVRWRRSLAPASSSTDSTVTRSDGRSLVARDAGSGVIESAELLLGESEAHGAPRRPVDVHAITIHELGHALGLSHASGTNRAASVMAARIVANEVTRDDLRVLRAWYALPVGLRCLAPTAQ
jgi:predicted Zn-dependent protease